MASAERVVQLKRALRSALFWLIVAMLAALAILHYVEQLGIAGATPSSHLGLTRHAMDRILFLFPIIYAGFVFRLRAGLVVCFIALLIRLPRVVFISSTPWDASLEMAGVLILGIVACFWFEAQRRAREQRQEAARELETMQQDLQSHIRLSRSSEKRLATLNAVATMLSRSLESEQVLRSALDMVTEVMEAEVALIFSLDERAQELRLMAYEGVSDRFAQDVDRMKLGEGLNGQVALSGEPLTVEDTSHDPRLTKGG
jgi:putative methionine-R-sulfoxide reductase with GAF domain